MGGVQHPWVPYDIHLAHLLQMLQTLDKEREPKIPFQTSQCAIGLQEECHLIFMRLFEGE